MQTWIQISINEAFFLFSNLCQGGGLLTQVSLCPLAVTFQNRGFLIFLKSEVEDLDQKACMFEAICKQA